MSADPVERDDRTTVHVAALTHEAEKALGRLSRRHRKQIAQKLECGVPFGRCKPVEKLARFQMRRFDVSKTLRVTLRRLPDGMTVFHAGTHSEADQFADLYKGNLPSHLIPIKESIAMKNLNKSHPRGAAPSSAAATKPVEAVPPSPPAAPPPSPSPVASEVDLLADAFKLMTGKLMDGKLQQIEGDIISMGDRVRAEAEVNTQTQVRELKAVQEKQQQTIQQNADATRTTLRDEVVKLRERLTADLAAVQEKQRQTLQQNADATRTAQTAIREEATKLRERLTAELGVLRADVEKNKATQTAQAADVVRGREELLVHINALRAASEEREQEREKATESLRTGLATADQCLREHAALAHRHGESIDQIEQQVQRVAVQVSQLSAPLEERQSSLAAHLERVESELSQLGSQLGTFRDAVERLSRVPETPAPRSTLSKLLKRLRLA